MSLAVINQFMISILIMIGQFSSYNTHHILEEKPLPKLIIAGQNIKHYCGSSRHLGCYSAPSNTIVIKYLRPQNNFDYSILAHELFHYVQWHNNKRIYLEPETYSFERKFYKMLEHETFVLSDKNLTQSLVDEYKVSIN